MRGRAGEGETPRSPLLLPPSLPTVPPTAKPAWTREIHFPAMQPRIEERWGMDLKAKRQMIRTRRQILKTFKGQVGIC